MPSTLSDEELNCFLQEIGLNQRDAPAARKIEKNESIDQLFDKLHASSSKQEREKPGNSFFKKTAFILLGVILYLGLEIAAHYPAFIEMKKMRAELSGLQTQIASLQLYIEENFLKINPSLAPPQEIIEAIEPTPDIIR